jgi:hypothetical protein
MGTRGNIMVKALCYKLEDRGFQTRWAERIFSVCLILPVATLLITLRFTQIPTEINTRHRKIMFLWRRARPVRRAGSLAAICEPIV